MKVYIVTELLSRELIGNLILAAHIADRGHIAILLNQEDAFVLARGSVSGTTYFHAKSLHFSEERISQHRKLRDYGFLLTCLDQENSLLNPDIALVLSGRFCAENLELAHRVFTWNQLEAKELSKQFPKFSGKIMTSGSPRVDSWGPRFRELGVKAPNSKRQILLTPSVGSNHSLRHWERWAIWKSVSKDGLISDEDERQMLDNFRDELRSQVFFARLALRLADAFQDMDIVIQPKNSELKESWVKSLYAFDAHGDGKRPNLHLDYSRILEESIHSAEVVVNSTSTAGLTALLGGVPLVSFGPTTMVASQLGEQVTTIEQAFASVRAALKNPIDFVSSYHGNNLKMLGDRLTELDSRLAAERIVGDWEKYDSGVASRVTARDLLLYMYPGTLRRTLSAVKAIASFRRPDRAPPEKISRISQKRVNELLTRLLVGISTERKVKAVVVGGRNIIVSGKE